MNSWQECAEMVRKSLQGVLGAEFRVAVLSQEGQETAIHISSSASGDLPVLHEKFDITFMRGVKELISKDVLARGIAFTVVLAPKQFGIRINRQPTLFRARLP